MKLPVVSGREVVTILLRHGFVVRRQTGSHMILIRNAEPRAYVVVPIHSNKTLTPGTLLSILRQSRMTKEDLVK